MSSAAVGELGLQVISGHSSSKDQLVLRNMEPS